MLFVKFTDEFSKEGWRLQHDHLKVQAEARRNIFAQYRLRVGAETVPCEDGRQTDPEKTKHEGRVVLLYERPVLNGTAKPTHDIRDLIDPKKGPKRDGQGFVDTAVYQSMQNDVLWVSGWKSKDDAFNFSKKLTRVDGDHLWVVAVKRDYGKFDRSEAPRGAVEAQDAARAEGAPF